METGVDYNMRQLHKVGYFADLLSRNEKVNESIWPLLKFSRARSSFEEPKAISWKAQGRLAGRNFGEALLAMGIRIKPSQFLTSDTTQIRRAGCRAVAGSPERSP